MKYSHYYRKLNGLNVDIYRILDLFDITKPTIQHAIKKLFAAGNRGSKDKLQDYREAIDSILREIEIMQEKGEIEKIEIEIYNNTVAIYGKNNPRPKKELIPAGFNWKQIDAPAEAVEAFNAMQDDIKRHASDLLKKAERDKADKFIGG